MSALVRTFLLTAALLLPLSSIAQLPGTESGDIVRIEKGAAGVKGITRNQAVKIANQEALKSYKSLNDFKVVPCEQEIFWRVIYDEGGPEYLIDKRSGRIVRAQKTPQGEPDGSTSVTEAEAIEIAKRDMLAPTNGQRLDPFVVHSCELGKAWRIIIEPRIEFEGNTPVIPHSSTPNYVIDKASGKILFKHRG
jgi:hypothetical protein